MSTLSVAEAPPQAPLLPDAGIRQGAPDPLRQFVVNQWVKQPWTSLLLERRGEPSPIFQAALFGRTGQAFDLNDVLTSATATARQGLDQLFGLAYELVTVLQTRATQFDVAGQTADVRAGAAIQTAATAATQDDWADLRQSLDQELTEAVVNSRDPWLGALADASDRTESASIAGASDLTRSEVAPLAVADPKIGSLRLSLTQARSDYERLPPREVVLLLGRDFGAGLPIIAIAAGVSPTAVRKWRRGDEPRPGHRAKLVDFAAMCHELRAIEPPIYDPVSWLAMPLLHETAMRPIDLYLEGQPEAVLLIAYGGYDRAQILDSFAPGWRANYALDTEYEVIIHPDGTRSAVPRHDSR